MRSATLTLLGVSAALLGAPAHARERGAAGPSSVGILVYEGVELLDFSGPGEVFAVARRDGARLFDVRTVGLTRDTVRSQGFLTITPQASLADVSLPDVAVVPGGDVTRVMQSEAVLSWLARVRASGGTVFTVCNGASIAARAGLLDGLDVTTHHANLDLLALLAPAARVHADRRVVDNGQLVTAAGISAGIDGALWIVARTGGLESARATASHMEYDAWSDLEAQWAAQAAQAGVRGVRGRTFDLPADWGAFRLLRVLRQKGLDAAVQEHERLRRQAHGHDLDMLQDAGLAETAEWLFANSRAPEQVLSLFDLNARVHPGSALACASRAAAWERTARGAEAAGERARCAALGAGR